MKASAKEISAAICVFALCAAAAVYSSECSAGAARGIEVCLETLIPSLFPFMALSSFITGSGLAQKLGKPFEPIMKKLFGLDGCLAPVIIMSLVGGYPVGAQGISKLFGSGKISETQARRAALAAVCSGPGFTVSYVGAALYGSTRAGAIIFASQALSVPVLLFALRAVYRGEEANPKNPAVGIKKAERPCVSISDSIVEAARDGARGIFGICAFVVLFSAFLAMADGLTESKSVRYVLNALLEVCSAVKLLSEECPIEAAAFAAGFGGLCVHFQIFACLKKIGINKLLFFVIRIIQGSITAVFTHIGISLAGESAAVFSTGTVGEAQLGTGNMIYSAVLAAVMICFLFTLRGAGRKGACARSRKHKFRRSD